MIEIDIEQKEWEIKTYSLIIEIFKFSMFLISDLFVVFILIPIIIRCF